MELINKKYYDGFEGEPEIQLIYRKGDNNEILIIWEGYFDQIMKLMRPDAQGWTGLAYNYNMDTGWYEESPWLIKDLQMALTQNVGSGAGNLSGPGGASQRSKKKGGRPLNSTWIQPVRSPWRWTKISCGLWTDA